MNIRPRRRWLSGAALALVLLSSALLTGAGYDPQRFQKLGNNMMCACGCRQILLQCNHVGCTYSDSMRAELDAALSRGEPDDLVVQAFVQKYGATVLASPPAAGFNWLAWIMPFFTLLAASVVAALVVRRWRLRAAPAMAAGSPPLRPGLEEYRARARQETEL